MAKEDFDEILTLLGSGKWNYLYYFGFSLYAFVLASFILNGTYVVPNVEFVCDTSDLQDSIINNFTTDHCEYSIVHNDTEGIETETKEKCSKWNYTDPIFTKSMTSEFDLVCKQSYLRPMYQTVLTIGSFVGNMVCGFLSDRYGRKTMTVVGSIMAIFCVFITSFSSTFLTVLIIRFFTGLAAIPSIQTSFTLCMEICEPKHRTFVGMILAVPWAVGTIWWGVLGYLIRDWRWLLRASTLPACIYVFTLISISESPRWLIVSGYHEKALKTIDKAARWNHATLPPESDLLQRMEIIQKSSRRQSLTQENKRGVKDKLIKELKQIFILLRTSELRRRTLLIYVVFTVSSTVFYGLSFSAVNLNLDPFMYMVVGGLMEIPAYTIVVPVIAKYGRVKFTAVSYFICGIVIIMLAFIPNPKWLIITLAMIGKFCISASFQVIYLLAMEIFPTEVRMQGLGTAGSVSTLGGIAAPFITELIGAAYPWIPSLIFGGLSLLAGVATAFLPETTNKALPETVMQLEQEALRKKNRTQDKKEKKVMISENKV